MFDLQLEYIQIYSFVPFTAVILSERHRNREETRIILLLVSIYIYDPILTICISLLIPDMRKM